MKPFVEPLNRFYSIIAKPEHWRYGHTNKIIRTEYEPE